MAVHRLHPLVLFTILVSVTCTTAWYTTDDYPTREATTTYRYPDWTPDDRYTTPEYPDYTTGDGRYTTPDYPDYTTGDGRYTTPDYPDYTTGDGRYTTPDYPDYTTGDGRYTTPDYPDYTTGDGGYTSQEPPTSEPPNGTVPRCPRGWTLYRGNCYVLANASTSQGGHSYWLQADGLCRSMAPGGGLASIHDLSENFFLANMGGNGRYVWTGLFYDRSVPSGRYPYKWQDGTHQDFSYWQDGYPKYYRNEGCVYMDTYFYYARWAHTHCRNDYNFFCKAPPSREYIDVERDNEGCRPGFEGYGDNCYLFLPDQYLDQNDLNCYNQHEAEELSIVSADENDFVVERMKNISRYQRPAAFRLTGLQYYIDGGFYWTDYYVDDAPYHNFALEDMLNPMPHGNPRVYMDLSYGDWFISDTNARPMGMACKKPKEGRK